MQIVDLPSFFVEEIARNPLLTREEERKLAGRIKRGDRKAEKILINSNLRLVVKIARSFGNFGVDVHDLISEGCIGLQIAVKRYKPNRAKFSTYGSLWIRQRIMRYLSEHSSVVRVPPVWGQQFRRIQRAIAKLSDQGVELPSVMEISEMTGLKPSHVMKFQGGGNPKVVSMDAPLETGHETTTCLGDMMPDETTLDPAHMVERRGDFAAIRRLVDDLDPRLREIMRRRFGFRTGEPEKLEVIGRHFNITRERVRQLEASGLRQIAAQMVRLGENVDRSSLELTGTRAESDLAWSRARKRRVARGSKLLKGKREKARAHVNRLDREFASSDTAG